ncbi:MAG: aminopeptidase P family protein [Chloroflexi bacterium]|nr:aminopeptidase P family protein [Chloroflexota bacterium]
MADVSKLAFSPEEYGQRLAAVRQKMRERGADVLVVDESEHIAYLTGYGPGGTRYMPCVIPLDGDPVMIVRSVDEAKFLEESWLGNYIAFGDWEDPIQVLLKTLQKQGLAGKRVALEMDSHYLTVKRYEAIKAGLPEATIVDFSKVLWELRLRKSPQEIIYLRKASSVVDAAMLNAIQAAREGVSERQLAQVVYSTYLSLGADNVPVGPITSGSRSGSLHGRLEDRRLQKGDILHMELTPKVNGYSARLMRPTSIGGPTKAQSEVAKRLVEFQDQEFAAMKPGVPAREVDKVCRGQVLAAKLRDTYTNSTGYTLGYIGTPMTSDFTRIFIPTSGWALEEGMVFHMYVNAQGIAFSETVLVTKGGHERLTKLERKLFVR